MSMRRLGNNTGLTKEELDYVLGEMKREGKIMIGVGRRKIVMLKS